MTKPVERKMKKKIKGQPPTIRSRIATATHAATTSVAQIEFAASQNRQEVTKLDENEADAATEIRLWNALDEKLLMYCLTLVVTLIVVFMLLNESGFSLQSTTKSSAERWGMGSAFWSGFSVTMAILQVSNLDESAVPAPDF
jgi:hypothetical protein